MITGQPNGMVHLDTVIVGAIAHLPATEYTLLVGEGTARRLGIDRMSMARSAMSELEAAWRSLDKSEAKLSNRSFVERAKPEVVSMEEKKWSDSMATVEMAENRLGRLLGIQIEPK